MNHHGIQRDSAAWLFFVRASFVLSVVAVGIGIFYVPAPAWVKGYLGMGMLFLTGSAFTLAKTLRDDHEATKLINKISDAKTEKLLKDY